MGSAGKYREPGIWNITFSILMMISFFQTMGQMMMNVLIPLYVYDIGAPAQIVGMTVGAFAISAILVRPFIGPAFDAFNKKMILIISLLVIAVSTFLYSVATTVTAIFVIRLLHGAGLATSAALAQAMAADALPIQKMNSGISIFGLALAVSQAIGPIVGLTLLDFVGFQWAFRISALVIVGGLILACLIKEPGNHVRKPYQLKLDRMFSKGAVIPALMIALLSIPFSCINAFIVIYGNLLGIGGMGAYFAVYAGCLLATRPLFGSLSDKHGVQRIIPIGLCFFVASILVFTLASNLPLFLLAAAVGACGYGAVIPLLQSLGFLCSPYDSRGAASNTTFLGLDAGNLVGPTIGGMIVSLFIASGLSEAQSYNGMFFVLIVPVLIAFTVFLMARKSVMRPAK